MGWIDLGTESTPDGLWQCTECLEIVRSQNKETHEYRSCINCKEAKHTTTATQLVCIKYGSAAYQSRIKYDDYSPAFIRRATKSSDENSRFDARCISLAMKCRYYRHETP